MKKNILLLLTLFVSFFALAQDPIITTLGATNRAFKYLGGVKVDSCLIIPVQSNNAVYAGLPQKGRIRVNSATNLFQYHNGTTWINLANGIPSWADVLAIGNVADRDVYMSNHKIYLGSNSDFSIREQNVSGDLHHILKSNAYSLELESDRLLANGKDIGTSISVNGDTPVLFDINGIANINALQGITGYGVDNTDVNNPVITDLTVSDITALVNFTRNSPTIVVKDKDRGGVFHYSANGVLDGGTVFPATGVGSGYWVRDVVNAKGVSVKWFGAKGDYNPAALTGTDDTVAIQAAIDSKPNKNTPVYFPYGNYKATGSLYYGEGTKIFGENSLFPYQIQGADTITYKSQTAIYWTADVDGFLPTQDVVSYRNQGNVIEDIGLFGTGKNNGKIAITYSSNLNTTAAIKRAGLCITRHCYIDGWDTGASANVTTDGSGDSWTIENCHFSNCKKGVVTGNLGESFGYYNDFYSIDDVAVTLNGQAEVWTGNEVEPNSTAIGFLFNTNKYSDVHNNVFTNVATALSTTPNSSRSRFHNNLVRNATSHSVILNSGLSQDISYNQFVQGSEVATTTENFIRATTVAGLFIKGNTFSRFGGGMTTPLFIDSCSSTRVENNINYGFASTTSSIYNIIGTSYTSSHEYGNKEFIGGINVSSNIVSAGTITGTNMTGSANPSALIGMTANNGVATTFQRSDATAAINPAIAPTWSAQHNFTSTTTTPPVIITGSTSGSDLTQWVRSAGLTQSYGWSIGSRLFLKDLTTGSKVVFSAGQESSIGSIAAGMDATGTAAGASTRVRGLNAAGTNQNGGDFIISAGRGTGTGTAGRVIIEGNVSTTTGSSLSPPATAMTIDGLNVTVGGVIKASTPVATNDLTTKAYVDGLIAKMYNWSDKSASYTIVNTDGTINLTTGTATFTLPTAVGNLGNWFIIKNSGGGVLSVATVSSQTIDGAASPKLLNSTNMGFRLQSDGSNWKVTGSF